MKLEPHRESSPRVDALESMLDELELSASTLRRDPRGETWLPASAQRWCDEEPECRRAVERFVQTERELFDEADAGIDPFFTARVLGDLPRPLAWTGLTPRRRMAVLGAFHLAAAIVAVLVMQWAMPQSVAHVAQRAHGWLQADLDLSMLGGLAAVALVVLVAFGSSRAHTRAT